MDSNYGLKMLTIQDKVEALSQIDLLASSNPGMAADPAHIDLFADTIIALSGENEYSTYF